MLWGSTRRPCAPGRPGPSATCCPRSRSSTACSAWAGATWARSGTSTSCPTSPGSPCTTATGTTTTRAGPPRRASGMLFASAARFHRRRPGLPDAVWPEQAQRALRGLIHAFNEARDAGQPEIAPLVRDPLISSFRHAVRVGLAQVRADPGPRSSTKQPPDGSCWSSAATARPTSCCSSATPGSGPPTTSANAACARPRPSRRSPAPHQRDHHRRSPRHPQLHRHHAQTRRRRPDRHPRRPHRKPLAATTVRAHLSAAQPQHTPTTPTRRHPEPAAFKHVRNHHGLTSGNARPRH